jgi:hypothetical protein
MTNQTQPTALDAYMAAQTQALELAERIEAAIANHDTVPAPEQINWGHVGDMNETIRQLREISDRLFAEGEYATEAR